MFSYVKWLKLTVLLAAVYKSKLDLHDVLLSVSLLT